MNNGPKNGTRSANRYFCRFSDKDVADAADVAEMGKLAPQNAHIPHVLFIVQEFSLLKLKENNIKLKMSISVKISAFCL